MKQTGEGNLPIKLETMKRKIENFIFDCIIYFAAFGLMSGFVYLCALADKWVGV